MTRSYHNSKISCRSSFSLNTLLTILTGILLLLNSCEEEGTIIGKKILPPDDFVTIFSTDTISVRSFTMYSDSLESGNPSYSYLGQLYDPYFGTTAAEFVTQIRMNKVWKEGVYKVDSVKLVLRFEDVSGNTSPGHILKLSEIAEEINTDSTYYSNRTVPLTGYSVEVSLPELKADTVNTVSIDLDPSFGEYLIRNTTMLFMSNDEPDFRSYFKGLYFQLIPSGDPVFLTLNLEPPEEFGFYKHELVVHMHDVDSVYSEMIFLIDAKVKNAAFNKYTHDFNTAEAGKKIAHINDGFRDTLTYQQCLNGVYTKFTIPALEEIKNDPSLKGIIVNKARIICPVHYDGGAYKGSSFPSQLYVVFCDKSGAKYIVPDYKIDPAFYGGTIDTTAGYYNFNIPSYVKQFLADTTDTYKPEFQLVLPSGLLRNAILKANNSATPIKFELTYTRF